MSKGNQRHCINPTDQFHTFVQIENIQEIKECTLPFIQIEKKISLKRTLLIVIYTNNASEEQCKAVYKLEYKFINIYVQS